MYRCEICGCCSKPGEGRKTHVVEREVPRLVVRGRDHLGRPSLDQAGFRREVARELAVCTGCHVELQMGVPLDRLLARDRAERVARGQMTRRAADSPQPSPLPTPVVVGKPITRKQSK